MAKKDNASKAPKKMPAPKLNPLPLSLTMEEQNEIRGRLKRPPNMTEWSMLEVMWSEHCSYKSSKPFLRMFPTKNKHVVVGPGYDAGVIDIGGGWCAAFKIESHNHPSAIDPYSGSATGVGGILRDILAMGAQPVALLDSIHFGSMKSAHSQWLLKNVVKGIGDYGNCVGVPTVAGEVQFDSTFEGNCIVNAACVGFVRKEDILFGKAKEAGDLLVLVGGSTGRDGIHGVTFASRNLSDASEADRPAVQIADPFTKKLIIDACLECYKTGKVKALKDLGGGGLTCASSELCFKGGLGAEIDVEKINVREPDMKAFEIMLSESQERMLFELAPEDLPTLTAIFDKYGLTWRVIGKVQQGDYVVRSGQEIVAKMPASLLTEPLLADRKGKKPAYIDQLRKAKLPAEPQNLSATLLSLLASENIASREWVYSQYDHEVGDRSVMKCGRGDAAVVLAPNGKGIATKADGNSLACYADPYCGGAFIICEGARNLACVGGRAIAMADNLNYGSPERPEVVWQFSESIRGMTDACNAFDIACVGGNVSFYNEDDKRKLSIKPTPVVVTVGVVDDVQNIPSGGFSEGEDIVVVAGPDFNLGASEYLRHAHNLEGCDPPTVDVKLERAAVDFVLSAISKKLVASAHDISKGGAAISISEMCVRGKCGASVELGAPAGTRADAALFSENSAKFVLGTRNSEELLALAQKMGVTAYKAGTAGGMNIVIMACGREARVSVDEASKAYSSGVKV